MQSWKLLNLETTFWHLTRYCMFTIYNTEFLAKFKANFLPFFLEWKRKLTNFSSFTKKYNFRKDFRCVFEKTWDLLQILRHHLENLFNMTYGSRISSGFHNFSTTSDYKSRDLLFLDSTFHLETYVNIFPFFCNLRW